MLPHMASRCWLLCMNCDHAGQNRVSHLAVQSSLAVNRTPSPNAQSQTLAVCPLSAIRQRPVGGKPSACAELVAEDVSCCGCASAPCL